MIPFKETLIGSLIIGVAIVAILMGAILLILWGLWLVFT
jgi:hypothetical protein